MLVLNLVCRDKMLRASVLATLSGVWASTVTYALSEDVNEVVFCSNSSKLSNGQGKKVLSAAFKLVNTHVQKATKSDEDLIDLEDSLKVLKISR